VAQKLFLDRGGGGGKEGGPKTGGHKKKVFAGLGPFFCLCPSNRRSLKKMSSPDMKRFFAPKIMAQNTGLRGVKVAQVGAKIFPGRAAASPTFRAYGV